MLETAAPERVEPVEIMRVPRRLTDRVRYRFTRIDRFTATLQFFGRHAPSLLDRIVITATRRSDRLDWVAHLRDGSMLQFAPNKKMLGELRKLFAGEQSVIENEILGPEQGFGRRGA